MAEPHKHYWSNKDRDILKHYSINRFFDNMERYIALRQKRFLDENEAQHMKELESSLLEDAKDIRRPALFLWTQGQDQLREQ